MKNSLNWSSSESDFIVLDLGGIVCSNSPLGFHFLEIGIKKVN